MTQTQSLVAALNDHAANVGAARVAHATDVANRTTDHDLDIAAANQAYQDQVATEQEALQDELDLAPAGGKPPTPEPWTTVADLQRAHDEAVDQARKALAGTTDAHLATPWKLLVSGQTVLTSPRQIVIADTFTHLAHHRGQLTVYMRLNGKTVPSVYGPSADERTFG